MEQQDYNLYVTSRLIGRKLRPDCMPVKHTFRPMFSFWGEELKLGSGDIHNSRAYRIYLSYGDDLIIRAADIVVDGELLSPCSGFSYEQLDEFDYAAVLSWCLDHTAPA